MRDAAGVAPALRDLAAAGALQEPVAVRLTAYLERAAEQAGLSQPSLRDLCGLLLRAEDVARGARVGVYEAEVALSHLGQVVLRECAAGHPPHSVTSTGCTRLDRVLQGGFLNGTVTELAGPAGVGKSQLLLQTALHSLIPPAAHPQPNCLSLSRAVFIACESFPCDRAYQLARALALRHAESPRADELMDRLLISGRRPRESHIDHLKHCVANLRRLLESGSRVTCVALDSIAAACGDYAGEAAVRAPLISQIAQDLKQLAAVHSFPVLVANHVVSVIEPEADHTHRVYGVRPALGLAWSSLPNTHVLMLRDGVGVRRLHVTASAHLPIGSVVYEVRTDGVFGASE